MKGRVYFGAGAVQHVYQNTHNGFLIFYSVRDCLVFFTVFMVAARSHRVRVLGLCLMPDHIHVLVEADCKEDLFRFVQHYTAWFTALWNARHGQSGSLFRGPFGFASKVTDKAIRSAVAYLFNNPVEKRMATRPELARWNFMPYAISRYPFSEPIRKEFAGFALRNALKEVDFACKASRPLSYITLDRLSAKLTSEEQQQLSDYIISAYSVIDYEKAVSYYGSYENMVMAVNTAKGSEYDIKEEFLPGSDTVYSRMSALLIKEGIISDVDQLLLLPEERRLELLEPLALATGAGPRKTAKYLRLEHNSLNLR